MPSLSPAIAERARKNHTAILQALAEVSQARVAELMGVSEATVSRIKSKDLEEISAFIAACAIKCTPESLECWPKDYMRALHVLAGMQIQNPPDRLAGTWE